MPFSGNDNVSANIDNHFIISENENEPLGIILDSKLSFEDHINNLGKKQVKNATHKQELFHTCVLKKGKQP